MYTLMKTILSRDRKMDTWYDEPIFTTADEFLAYLRPTAKHWATEWWNDGDYTLRWVFRGQKSSSEKFRLLPAAWRQDVPFFSSFYKVWRDRISELCHEVEKVRGAGGSPETWASLTKIVLTSAAEQEAFQAFCELASRVGHPLPQDAPPESFDDVVSHIGSSYPYRDHIYKPSSHLDGIVFPAPCRLRALAQHHGIPTRLLDFTTDPLVAAFFALVEGLLSPGYRAPSVFR
jgi:FRG domain-containing protein